LKDYFVATPTFREIDQSNDCIVSGRKGTGKTALFYEIRRKYWNKRKFIVLDLKPEGHQLKLLSEVITENFFRGSKKIFN
jgi:MinD superfamily P-loop ATPase